MIFSGGKIVHQTLSNPLMFIFVHGLKVVIFLEVHGILFFFSKKFSNFIDLRLSFKGTPNIFSLIFGNTVMHFQSFENTVSFNLWFWKFPVQFNLFCKRIENMLCIHIGSLLDQRNNISSFRSKGALRCLCCIFPKVVTPIEWAHKVLNQAKP